MFNTKPTLEVRAIAGKHSGNLVTCSPNAQPIYNALEQKAKSGNHWARITVAGLQSLCAGRMHLNNVFIKPATNISYGNEEFFLILPGCKATVEKRSNGQFRVLYIEVDTNYGKLQEEGHKPGLWRANRVGKGWNASYIKNGHIKGKDNRVVAITDSGHSEPKDALDDSSSHIINAPISVGEISLIKDGFDMHYTPGTGIIGGLVNARKAAMAERDPSLNESALILAKAMYSARNIESVRWLSVRGGSGVLTQAMQILADQGITSKGHYVQFSSPTTNLSKAVLLAQRLELSKLRNYHHNRKMADPHQLTGGGVLSNYVVPYHRLKHDEDYDSLKFIGDIYKGTGAIKAASVTTLAVGSAVGLTSGVSIPSTLMVIGTIAGAASLAPKLTEAYLPRLHNKIKGRF